MISFDLLRSTKLVTIFVVAPPIEHNAAPPVTNNDNPPVYMYGNCPNCPAVGPPLNMILSLLFITVICCVTLISTQSVRGPIQCHIQTLGTGKGLFTYYGKLGPNNDYPCSRNAPGKITSYSWIKSGGCKNGGQLTVSGSIIHFQCSCTKWFKPCDIDHALAFDYTT